MSKRTVDAEQPGRTVRVVLLYPPPWKVCPTGAPPAPAGEGPPEGFREADIDIDFFQIPYGLLSLAAQLLRAGHPVRVLNLSSFPWPEVEQVIQALEAEVWGMSCFTANRRGVAMVADCIRKAHPQSSIVVGGPHATALPIELLAHHPALDLVCLGEGEETLCEIVERLAQGRSLHGIPGTAFRRNGRPELAEARPRIGDLDRLASPHDYFDTHLFMTSRGCPGQCTFCAKNVVWGRKYRRHSVGYVLDSLQAALSRLPLKMLMVKDDTFTADRKRALAICRGIQARDLKFVWSCDTRADALDEELALALRRAGCQRLSLGVESGSPVVLRAIRKNISPETVAQATEVAKQVGLQVRYFMMLGNRDETAETFRESTDFVHRAQPHQSIFACLSVYPGTADFNALEAAGVLDRRLFFEEDFQELKLPFDASDEDTELMSEWFYQHLGIQQHYRPTVEELRSVLARVGDLHAAHHDLSVACYVHGDLEGAERHAQRALELGYPLPALVHNTLAAVAAARGDVATTQRHLARAMSGAAHRVVVRNLRLWSAWTARDTATRESPPRLLAEQDFEVPEPATQPMLPGPLASDFAEW